jgi:hypothetical protein
MQGLNPGLLQNGGRVRGGLVDGFEEEMRKALQDCRNNYKDFFFTSGLVLNPGAEVPCTVGRVWAAALGT